MQLDSDWQPQPLGFDVSILAAHPQVCAVERFLSLGIRGWVKRGQDEDALIPLRKAVELGNKPYRALYLLGQALHEFGRRAEAIGCLIQALEMNRDYKAARTLLDASAEPSDSWSSR